MNTNFESLKEQLLAASTSAKDFIGAFLYEPLGIESSPMLNAVTLYFGLGILAMFLYRLSRPAPQPRYRKPIEYDYGRHP